MGDQKVYEKQIIDAIQTITDNSIARAGFDKTVQAVVLKCIDEVTGKYKVRYQDSVFFAYSSNPEIIYRVGSSVFVLIPGGDAGQNKTIISLVDQLQINSVAVLGEKDVYEYLGNNCVEENKSFELSSYVETLEKVLYSYQDNINLITLNVKDVEEYIKESYSIMLGVDVQTTLAPEQRFQGNYGVNLEFVYLDANQNEVIKNCLLDINSMKGNPYNFNVLTKQFKFFDKEGLSFLRIERLSIFAKGFPNQGGSPKKDIKFSNFEIAGAKPISQEELNGYGVFLSTPQGTYFESSDPAGAIKTIQAQVKVKGRLAGEDSQGIRYYWFRQNNQIKPNSIKYNQYGGSGWECLNSYNTIEENVAVEWVADNDLLIVQKETIPAKQQEYKCVAIYGDSILIEKRIVLYNYSSEYIINLSSTNGVKFLSDAGETNLIAKINGLEEVGADYDYVWSVADSKGNVTFIETAAAATQEFLDAKDAYENLMNAIAAGTVSIEATQGDLNNYISIINAYENSMRVEKNVLVGVRANTILKESVYKCSIYYNQNYIGTASISLVNVPEEAASDYGLNLNGANQSFQYNENGVSPTSKGRLQPQTIVPLSFTLYNKIGEPISLEGLPEKAIQWRVPRENTLLVRSGLNGISEPQGDYDLYFDKEVLYFEINNTYSPQKRNNDIELQVKLDDHVVLAETAFTFIKQGEAGTNGTEVFCKIVPNTVDDSFVQYPTVTFNETSETIRLNYDRPTGNADQWFKVQMWENGERIFEGTQTGDREDQSETPVEVKWSILKNYYTPMIRDYSNFAIDSETGGVSFDPTDYLTNGHVPANLVQCEVKMLGNTYYAVLPVLFARVMSSDYEISLKENSGFSSAMYAADGTRPSYDNYSPHEVLVTENGEDASLHSEMSYHWSELGAVYYSSWKNSIGLIPRQGANAGILKNQKYFQPTSLFDGLCLTNSILCNIVKEEDSVGSILIPIYLYLNRYGQAALNGWNGNHVELNTEGGLILSPQIGAGKKEADNSFTGLFMGSVKTPGALDLEAGLFGYNKGEQTIKLDAKDGSATFGKAGSGQILIDPEAGAAIRGGNYNYTGDENGSGMEINLEEPSIKYGTGKFEIDAQGNVEMQDATLNNVLIKGGELKFSDGTEVIGAKGILTNLTFSSSPANGVGNMIESVGWFADGPPFSKMRIQIKYFIPKNFFIESVKVSFYHSPVEVYSPSGNYEEKGHSRDIRVFKAPNKKDAIYANFGYYSWDFSFESLGGFEIPLAFGAPYTPSSSPSAGTLEEKESVELKNYFEDDEKGLLYFQTGEGAPSSSRETALRSGVCYATLNILGYARF